MILLKSGKTAIILSLLISLVCACKKEELVCANEVVNDENFILFPKTGGLWVFKSTGYNQPHNITTDTFTIGLPVFKLVKVIPDTSHYYLYANPVPVLKEYYPVLRQHTLQDSLGNLISVVADTMFCIREDLNKNIIYRTIDFSSTGGPQGLYEVVHMNYNSKPGNRAKMYITDNPNNSRNYTITGVDSIYFQKRYLKRFFTVQIQSKIIQGFQPVLGAYESALYTPSQKKGPFIIRATVSFQTCINSPLPANVVS